MASDKTRQPRREPGHAEDTRELTSTDNEYHDQTSTSVVQLESWDTENTNVTTVPPVEGEALSQAPAATPNDDDSLMSTHAEKDEKVSSKTHGGQLSDSECKYGRKRTIDEISTTSVEKRSRKQSMCLLKFNIEHVVASMRVIMQLFHVDKDHFT